MNELLNEENEEEFYTIKEIPEVNNQHLSKGLLSPSSKNNKLAKSNKNVKVKINEVLKTDDLNSSMNKWLSDKQMKDNYQYLNILHKIYLFLVSIKIGYGIYLLISNDKLKKQSKLIYIFIIYFTFLFVFLLLICLILVTYSIIMSNKFILSNKISNRIYKILVIILIASYIISLLYSILLIIIIIIKKKKINEKSYRFIFLNFIVISFFLVYFLLENKAKSDEEMLLLSKKLSSRQTKLSKLKKIKEKVYLKVGYDLLSEGEFNNIEQEIKESLKYSGQLSCNRELIKINNYFNKQELNFSDNDDDNKLNKSKNSSFASSSDEALSKNEIKQIERDKQKNLMKKKYCKYDIMREGSDDEYYNKIKNKILNQININKNLDFANQCNNYSGIVDQKQIKRLYTNQNDINVLNNNDIIDKNNYISNINLKEYYDKFKPTNPKRRQSRDDRNIEGRRNSLLQVNLNDQ